MSASLDLSKTVQPFLSWYDQAARVLSWRENPQPYRVRVSEVVLQRTRVGAVKPYYERFLLALPTVETLADVPGELLLKLWEGLGYYNHVRNLQRAALIMKEQYGGQIPASFDALLALPGPGEYTVGAVAPIAFGIRVPTVDGNVLRMISHLTADRRGMKDTTVKRQITEAVCEILPEQVGDFNQSLMKLGAAVYLPNGTSLRLLCPLNSLCIAFREGIVAELPVRTVERPRVIEERTVFPLCTGGRVALRRRLVKGPLVGLWELPSVPEVFTPEEAEDQLREWGLSEFAVQPLPKAKHIFTHREQHMTAYAARVPRPFGEFVWATYRELLKQYMLPSAFKSYADMLRDWISIDI